MTIDFESDAQAITVQDNSLAAISELGRQAILIEKDMRFADSQVKYFKNCTAVYDLFF